MLLKTSKGDISTHTPQNWFILLKGIEYKTSLNLTTRKRNEMAKKTQGRHRFLFFQAREGALGPNKQTKVIPRLTVNAGKTILQGILEQRKLTLQKSIYKDCAYSDLWAIVLAEAESLLPKEQDLHRDMNTRGKKMKEDETKVRDAKKSERRHS